MSSMHVMASATPLNQHTKWLAPGRGPTGPRLRQFRQLVPTTRASAAISRRWGSLHQLAGMLSADQLEVPPCVRCRFIYAFSPSA
jgi:hypothetical protein